MANNTEQNNNSDIVILQALYGTGEFVQSIDNFIEDYLIHIYDNNYQLVNIIHPIDY